MRIESGTTPWDSAASGPFHGVVGRSPTMLAALGLILKAARYPLANVLLLGETGTGKELFARAIHNASPNAGEPFVAINCSAIPEALLESELFGHEKGASTDARTSKQGLLEVAGAGTVLLDQIGEIPVNLQPKLLRVLEERRVRRVGGLTEYELGCRVIAASNVDLAAAVDEGSFRSDLFYRLGVMRIDLPPLRERDGDVELLARHFVSSICRDHGLPPKTLSREALAALGPHQWLGNVRELKNTMETAILRSEGETIYPEHIWLRKRRTVPMSGAALIAESLARSGNGAGPTGDPSDPGEWALPPEGITLQEMERLLVRETLRVAEGNRSRAARMLGISRPTVLRKIKLYGLDDA